VSDRILAQGLAMQLKLVIPLPQSLMSWDYSVDHHAGLHLFQWFTLVLS
jgi:hypothetical protein